jgi:hypothetical protein
MKKFTRKIFLENRWEGMTEDEHNGCITGKDETSGNFQTKMWREWNDISIPLFTKMYELAK